MQAGFRSYFRVGLNCHRFVTCQEGSLYMPRPIHSSTKYVPALDGIRSLAVLLVIAYHLNLPGFGGGLLGVGVFFTLSGYLITLNLMNSHLRHGTLKLRTFWVRRFRRLAPAMLTTVLAVLILSVAFDAANLRTRAFEALSSVVYLNNWHNIATGTSYFDRFNGPGPLDHMWSLSIEEQFYLLWPLVLWALLKIFRRPWLVAAATTVLAGASFAWMWVLAQPEVDPTRVYEGTDTRAGGLLLGAVLAIIVASRRHENKKVATSPIAGTLVGAVGFGGIFALSMLVAQENMFLYKGGILLLNVATVLAIYSVLGARGPWTAILSWEPLRWIGERSYGIYLWHMPVIYFMPQTWRTEHLFWASVLAIGLSVVLAALSWTLFENPIRRHGVFGPLKYYKKQPLQALRPASLGSMVTLIGVISIGITALFAQQGSNPQQPAMALPAEAQSGGSRERTQEEETTAEEAPAASWENQDADTTMACRQVIHVGDSTSIGMFDPGQLPEGAETAIDRYLDAGADSVETSVFGARATNQGFNGNGENYPSAIESVQELLNMGAADEGTCWVIATGVNDAANADAARSYGYDPTGELEENIRKMLELLDGYRVMWPTAATGSPSNSYYANENMEEFNEALRKVAKERHDVVVYDWAAEARANLGWFLAGDEVHYNAEGNDVRGIRFAAALAHAFPTGVETADIPKEAEVSSEGPK